MAGKNAGLFKPFLFADQDLDTLAVEMVPPKGELAEAAEHLRAGDPAEAEVVLASAIAVRPDVVGGWHSLLLAVAQSRRGNDGAAVKTLRALAERAPESRIVLWAWHALRTRGVVPEGAAGDRVEGVIVEVEGGEGVDTLAAYADGTARYLVPSGARVIWDAPDKRLTDAIARVVAAGQASLAATTPGRLPGEPGKGMARMTLLTRGGPRSAEEPLADAASNASPRAPLFAAATTLLEKILAITKW
jgi:hypothetical protein